MPREAAVAVEVMVNGAPRSVPAGTTVAGLIEGLGLSGRWTVVECNGEPLPRDRFAATPLAPGDRLEVVRPVAGG